MGWKLELQAPNGSHINVIDLSIFPAMSHRHSAQIQLNNNTEASLDAIWSTVVEVF
jgi:hypothetical protein